MLFIQTEGYSAERICTEIALGDIDGVYMAVFDIYQELHCPSMDDHDLAQLWIAVRLEVPRLVVKAFDGERLAITLLNVIRQQFDPTIQVPWRFLSSVTQEQLNEPPDNGEAGYAVQAKLRNFWEAAMARTIAIEPS
jgi:hypothetical protein